MNASCMRRVNKSLDNKEEATYRRAKERTTWEKHKRVIRYLKNRVNQNDSTEMACSTPSCSLWGVGGRLPEGKPSSSCNRLAKLSLEQLLHHPQILTLLWGYHDTKFLLHGWPAARQDNPTFSQRHHLERACGLSLASQDTWLQSPCMCSEPRS
jgi:hypothetical protein